MSKQEKSWDFIRLILRKGQRRSEISLAFLPEWIIIRITRSGKVRKKRPLPLQQRKRIEVTLMKMSDTIAAFILECLSDGGGVAELQRRGLAERFSCVPSQINYVIETRFTPENGYLVESRRGGGG